MYCSIQRPSVLTKASCVHTVNVRVKCKELTQLFDLNHPRNINLTLINQLRLTDLIHHEKRKAYAKLPASN